MAIDTRQKRQSAGLIGLPFKVGTVVPTGTIGVDQRQAAGWYYSGIASTAAVITGTYNLTLPKRSITLTLRKRGS